ncbi:SUN domain-containing protein 1 [Nibea albiflora]|uniref:SUN domain-containing protein 1 n=1 Tax=Nibea albiflora TaxID=240163 RepID=A0ACB7FKQ6_NIBAL|nr:SUN domain-containing protein 1 [Nibea albiflora]
MSRRSSRLVSGGYYNSDEESDSSSVTNISYRENPVKVFKKKAGTRKARTPNSARNNAGSDSPVTAGLSPSPLTIETQSTPKTYASAIATPRPALTPSASRSQTPIRCPQEKSPDDWLCSSSRPGLHPRPSHKELSQSSVDSSGYSSSEGPLKKPTPAAASSIGGIHDNGGTLRNRISTAFFSLMGEYCSVCVCMFVSVHACVIISLFHVLCADSVSCMATAVRSKDPAVVSAAVEVKMQRVLEELQLKQERLLTQMKEKLQLDMQNMKADLEVADSDRRLRLEQELAGLVRQLASYQTESHSATGQPQPPDRRFRGPECQGASVISTRCSETYRIRSACVTLFGFPLWYPSESPRTVIQGYPVLLPGKCWAFHGVQGTLVISLSHPIKITHVTLDHLPRYNSPTGRIDSAPKDFEVYGMQNDTEEGTLLGTFTYDENGESTQTFKLPTPSDVVYRYVELRVLSNWGHVEYTCLYRFRVHGNLST